MSEKKFLPLRENYCKFSKIKTVKFQVAMKALEKFNAFFKKLEDGSKTKKAKPNKKSQDLAERKKMLKRYSNAMRNEMEQVVLMKRKIKKEVNTIKEEKLDSSDFGHSSGCNTNDDPTSELKKKDTESANNSNILKRPRLENQSSKKCETVIPHPIRKRKNPSKSDLTKLQSSNQSSKKCKTVISHPIRKRKKSSKSDLTKLQSSNQNSKKCETVISHPIQKRKKSSKSDLNELQSSDKASSEAKGEKNIDSSTFNISDNTESSKCSILDNEDVLPDNNIQLAQMEHVPNNVQCNTNSQPLLLTFDKPSTSKGSFRYRNKGEGFVYFKAKKVIQGQPFAIEAHKSFLLSGDGPSTSKDFGKDSNENVSSQVKKKNTDPSTSSISDNNSESSQRVMLDIVQRYFKGLNRIVGPAYRDNYYIVSKLSDLDKDEPDLQNQEKVAIPCIEQQKNLTTYKSQNKEKKNLTTSKLSNSFQHNCKKAVPSIKKTKKSCKKHTLINDHSKLDDSPQKNHEKIVATSVKKTKESSRKPTQTKDYNENIKAPSKKIQDSQNCTKVVSQKPKKRTKSQRTNLSCNVRNKSAKQKNGETKIDVRVKDETPDTSEDSRNVTKDAPPQREDLRKNVSSEEDL